MERDNWSGLIIESTARPLPLPEDRFRAWMAGRHVFVSSTIDAEMNTVRQARDCLANDTVGEFGW